MSISLEISLRILAQAVDQSLDGITIADAQKPDLPLVYVNGGFEKMTGYSAAEVIGKNCRFLQGGETKQHGIEVVRHAIKNSESCIVILQNSRKNGALFWNEFTLSPVFDANRIVTHYIGVQKDVTARVDMLKHLRQSKSELQELNQQLQVLARTDGLTGIHNRRHFDEQLRAFYTMALRAQTPLAVIMVDLDFFKLFNDLYGHQAGDDCLILVSGIIADAFQRPCDCVARYGGEEFVVATLDLSQAELVKRAQLLCDKVHESQIPHRDSPHSLVTISVGAVSRTPKHDVLPSDLLKLADRALYKAKQQGRNCTFIK
jgi:diguanylate cyclase (GGDEF)-like protein/PAS domain S-box-containing protein